jgi:hypothetical protein
MDQFISIAISVFALFVSWAGVAASIVGVAVSYWVARKYGDMAAVRAGRKLHDEDARRARVTALRSLLNETERIRKVVEHNASLAIYPVRSVIRLPTSAFETAFVSGTPGLDASDELLRSVTDYLVRADAVNSFVDAYPSSIAGQSGNIGPNDFVGAIVDACASTGQSDQETFAGLLGRLRACLQEEILHVEQEVAGDDD